MGTLDVQGVVAIGFEVTTSVTTSDGAGGTTTFSVEPETWIGIPAEQGHTMTAGNAGERALCMTRGSYNKKGDGSFVQVMTVDEVRTIT